MSSNYNNLTLVILAAGMGSRYGGLKQLDSFGPNGETIMDYSIVDAIQAGFGKIIFVVRAEFHQIIRDRFSKKYEHLADLFFVNQEVSDLPCNIKLRENRTKPWGTAHAVWATRNVVEDQFAVINADDFYGRESYFSLANFLLNNSDNDFALITYKLRHTLSNYGTVNRAICDINNFGYLDHIQECLNIKQENENTAIYDNNNNIEGRISLDSPVSMNMFGLPQSFFSIFEEMFPSFLSTFGDEKSELYIPLVVDFAIKNNHCKFKAIPSFSQWYGVTYPSDKEYVSASLSSLHYFVEQNNVVKNEGI